MTARINTTDKSVDLFGSGKHGFKETAPATEFSAEWCNNVQEAIAQSVEAAGFTVTTDDHTQLWDSMIVLGGAGTVDFTANTTLTAADTNKLVIGSGTTASTVLTLPTMSTMVAGGRFWIINHNTQTVSVTRASTDVIRTVGGTTVTSITLFPGASLFLVKGNTAGQWEVFGGSYQNQVARQFAYFREEQTSGTNGGTSSAGWNTTRTLNTTVYNSITGCSLGSNLVTLPAGTYLIKGITPFSASGQFITRIYNSSDTAIIVRGSNAGDNAGYAIAETVVTLSASKNIRLDTYTVEAVASTGLGTAVSEGTNEVYSEMFIERLY